MSSRIQQLHARWAIATAKFHEARAQLPEYAYYERDWNNARKPKRFTMRASRESMEQAAEALPEFQLMEQAKSNYAAALRAAQSTEVKV